MTKLYLQEISLDSETKSYLRSIPSEEKAGKREIKEKTNLFLKKVKEELKNEYPFLNFNLFDIELDRREEMVYIVFDPRCGWSYNIKEVCRELFHLNFDNNEDFKEYCERQFKEKFGKELKQSQELKDRINYLEGKLKSYESDFDYTKIQYKNLNDLNSAKFLSDDEKKAILGIPIKKL
jgi:hypothetical protein